MEAITMKPSGEDGGYYDISSVDETRCIGCRFCERVCIKEAIKVQKHGVKTQHAVRE
jgi:formate hydrogenlyase subunit 6/NADH:ubiquinone oxidoreductase subunit I